MEISGQEACYCLLEAPRPSGSILVSKGSRGYCGTSETRFDSDCCINRFFAMPRLRNPEGLFTGFQGFDVTFHRSGPLLGADTTTLRCERLMIYKLCTSLEALCTRIMSIILTPFLSLEKTISITSDEKMRSRNELDLNVSLERLILKAAIDIFGVLGDMKICSLSPDPPRLLVCCAT